MLAQAKFIHSDKRDKRFTVGVIGDFYEELKNRNMTLYAAVHPALADGIYYDGYDYREIGRLADKVILMAHDYNTNSLEGFIGIEWYKTTAPTPIASVYYSLKAITYSKTGV